MFFVFCWLWVILLVNSGFASLYTINSVQGRGEPIRAPGLYFLPAHSIFFIHFQKKIFSLRKFRALNRPGPGVVTPVMPPIAATEGMYVKLSMVTNVLRGGFPAVVGEKLDG